MDAVLTELVIKLVGSESYTSFHRAIPYQIVNMLHLRPGENADMHATGDAIVATFEKKQ